MNEAFRIAGRYIIDPVRNTVLDTQTNEDTRIEQRIMIVLCLLADQAGELVSREKLIKDVWDDYGGADEALTQVISFLRKILNDTDKKIIETVPKRGYILNAEIAKITASEPIAENLESKSNSSKKPVYLILAGSLILILIICFLLFSNRNKPSSPDVLDANKATTGKHDSITNPDIRPDLERKQDTAKSSDLR